METIGDMDGFLRLAMRQNWGAGGGLVANVSEDGSYSQRQIPRVAAMAEEEA